MPDGQRGGERDGPMGAYHAEGTQAQGNTQVVWRWDTVSSSAGPVRCTGEGEPGVRPPCGNVLGCPPAGARLVHLSEPGAYLTECEERFVAFRCSECKRILTFALPEVAGGTESP